MTAAVSPEPTPVPRPASVWDWLRPWGVLLGWIVLTVYLVVPPRDAMTPDLDSSNHGSYAWMLATHKQFGTEVVPMTGPYGFLFYGITYSGYLFWARLLGDLALKAVLSFVVFRLFTRAGPSLVRWLWLGAIFVFLPNVDDMCYDVAIFLSGLLLLLPRGPAPRFADYIAVVLLGFLSLLKGNHLILSAASIGAVALRGVIARQPAWVIRPALGWIASVLFFWVIAGQSVGHLPAYLRGILELASGYNSAMAYDENAVWFAAGVGVALGSLLTLGAVATLARRWEWLPLVLFVGGFSFAKWKHAYVRADGHVFIFFYFMAMALPSLWLAWHIARASCDRPASRWLRPATIALGLATYALAVVAASDFWSLRFFALFRDMPGYLSRNLAYLNAPGRYRERFERELTQNRIAHDVPQIRNEVGTASVDFFGFEQGLLLLNGLNYSPRPMGGGSFNVYTPYLQKLNDAFLRDPQRRPAWQVVKLRTLDNRLPAADDPLTLNALLQLYTPVLIQRDFLLLKERPKDTIAPRPQKLSEVAVKPGEKITVPDPGPDKLLLFSVRTPPSLLGRLRSFLYRPS
ncbi:MAG TPA: hypothetical protein VFJ90_07875, partial [Candidatus Didemnitutus sp.]|nr:hypothetical protein [Candidatus Didemnitutus sp.]